MPVLINKDTKVTIGTDPEVFLRDTETGLFVSAHGMFPGSKDSPSPIGNYGAVQVDGHALEFNTMPAETEDEFVLFVTETFNAVKDLVKSTDPSLEVVLEPVARFDDTYFQYLPEVSKILGCDPDWSADTGEAIERPNITNVPIRTSSGHIHIGWTKFDNEWDDEGFTLRMKVASTITPHLLTVSKKWETTDSEIRRAYYGGQGAFRPKHYGVELRCLDCLWLRDEESIREVYRTTVNSFKENFSAS